MSVKKSEMVDEYIETKAKATATATRKTQTTTKTNKQSQQRGLFTEKKRLVRILCHLSNLFNYYCVEVFRACCDDLEKSSRRDLKGAFPQFLLQA